MAESINDIAIKLGIDASGVGAGFGKASDYLADWYANYRKVMDAARRVAMVEATEHDAHVQARKQREQEFNNWYRKALDEEFQTWYAIELKKEKVIQNRIAEERQSRINQFNAAAQTGVMPADSPEREAELRQLREYTQQKYAALNAANETEQRLLRDNAANSQRELQRKAKQDDAERQKDAQNLKEWIIQVETLRAQEEAAMEAAAEARMLELRARRLYGEDDPYNNQADREARRAAQNARRQADADAARLLASEQREANDVVREGMNVTERYLEQKARLLHLSTVIDPVTRRNILSTEDYNAALARLTARYQNAAEAEARLAAGAVDTTDTTRIMSGVLAQASFAAEDFIQGMIFGDVRSALLGAANNVTMMARGMAQAAAESAVFRANMIFVARIVAIPAAIAGIGIALLKINSAARDMRDLAAFLREANFGLGIFENNLRSLQRSINFGAELRNLRDSEAAIEAIFKREEELAVLEREQQNAKRKADLEGAAIIEKMLGGAEARLELERQIEKTIRLGTEAEKEKGREAARLIRYAEEQAKLGNEQNAIQAMRELHKILSDGELRNWTEWIDDLAALDSLQEYFNSNMLGAVSRYLTDGQAEDAEKLLEIQEEIQKNYDAMNDLQQREADIVLQIIRLQREKLAMQERERKIREENLRMNAEEVNIRRKEMMGYGQPTAEQKKVDDAQKAAGQHMGESAALMMMGGMPGIAGGMDFLAAQAAAAAHMQHITEELQKQQMLREQQRTMDQDRLNTQRTEMLFMARATEAQKAMYQMQQQQAALLGESGAMAGMMGPMGLAGGMQLAHDMALNMAMMDARRQELEKQINEATQNDHPGYQESLMQNAWAAQGAATKQAFDAKMKSKDPQLEALLEELRLVKQAIQNGGLIQVIP